MSNICLSYLCGFYMNLLLSRFSHKQSNVQYVTYDILLDAMTTVPDYMSRHEGQITLTYTSY